MVTTFNLDEYVYEALRAGASGFLLKDAPPAQLLHGIRTVASRRRAAGAGGDPAARGQVRRPDPAHRGRAGRRRADPARAGGAPPIADGLSNSEIAAALVISRRPSRPTCRASSTKLDLRDRVQAVVYAYRRAW